MRAGIAWGCAALGVALRMLMLISALRDTSVRSNSGTIETPPTLLPCTLHN